MPTGGRGMFEKKLTNSEIKASLDDIVKSLLEASDEEVIASVRATGEDPGKVADETRKIIIDAIQKQKNTG